MKEREPLPPRVFEPEHLWGFLAVLVLNVFIWAPLVISIFLIWSCVDPLNF